MIGGEPDEAGTVHRVSARQALLVIISRMVETIVLEMMATLFWILFSMPVSFHAARYIMSGSPLTMALYYAVRFVMNVVRSIDPGPIQAIQAARANSLQTIAYAIIPQMISPFVSVSIYRWDIKVRMSTRIAVWFIAATVGLLDYVSAEIRKKLA